MPKLNEYIGSLVSSITNARVMSDIQTVKVAEEYAKHNLLKHFSIPRMRIDDVEMTIPIVLEEFIEKTESEFEPIDNIKFNSIVYKEILNYWGLSKLQAEMSLKLRTKIALYTQILEDNIRLTKDLSYFKQYCNDISTMFLEFGKEFSKSKVEIYKKVSQVDLSQYFQKTLEKEIKISSQKKTIEDLNVIAESYKLNEFKSEHIIYIKLKVSEDGMEWDSFENVDGKIEKKLLPE